jgi:excisionase family DNA binding protein
MRPVLTVQASEPHTTVVPASRVTVGGADPAPGTRLVVRVAEAARLLDIGRSKCYDLIRRGELPAIRVGKTVRVPLDALRQWIARQSQAEGGTT